MTTTPHLAISLVAQNQAQKEVTVNEALVTLDALLNSGAISLGDNAPPGSPANGDVYIIGSSPTGAWASKASQIAYYLDMWKFIEPAEGVSLWVNDEDTRYSYDGAAWTAAINISGGELQEIDLLGVNTTADATNKLSVKSNAVLFAADSGNVQLKVSKPTAGDTASYLFQTNYSGRAEFGLIGDDNFQLKVSADGSSFFQSLVVDKSTGNADFKQNLNITGTLSGEFKDYSETRNAVTATTTTTIDIESGNVIDLTHGADITTFTWSNPSASGKACSFTLIRTKDNSGTARSITWPAAVKWAGAVAPTLTQTANAVDIFTFITLNAGTTWYGFLAGADIR